MHISEFSVRRYQFTIVAFLMLAAVGVASIFSIPKTEDPAIVAPSYMIFAVYPGASPADMERLVVDKIEERLKELEAIKTIKSDVQDGVAFTMIEFFYGENADTKYQEVIRQVNIAKADLPADIMRLDIERATTSGVIIMQLALVSDQASYKDLGDYGEILKKRLEAVPSVKNAAYWAAPDQQVRIMLDPEKCVERGISVEQVIGTIQAANVNIPAGSVDVGSRKYNIKSCGQFTSIDQIRNTVISSGPSGIVRLRDVAAVFLQDADQNYIGRFNGKRAIFVTATQKDNQQIFKTFETLNVKTADFEKTLPSTIKLERGFDQSRNVGKRVGGLTEDLILAILLVLVTLLPLGTRASIIVMISIPLSLAIGITLLNYTGYSINQASIAGFVIALGLLVDDSIVIVENIARFIRNGYKPIEAAIAATKQIGPAVIGTTATLLFAFVPLLFLPGVPGQFIRSLPIAVVYAVLASLLVAFTVIPFLSSRVLREEKHFEGNAIYRFTMKWIHQLYRPVLRLALHWRWMTISLAALMVIGSLMLVPHVGFSLFPKAGIPQFLVSVNLPEGSSLQETDRIVRIVERELDKTGQVKYYFSNVGKGNPPVYYNIVAKNERNNLGEVLAEFNEYDIEKSPKMLDSLRSVFNCVPGCRIVVQEFEQGPGFDAPIAIRLIGDNLDSLSRAAEIIEQTMEQTEGTMYVDNPIRVNRQDLRVVVDREQAGMYGVLPAEIDKTVRFAVAGLSGGKYRTKEGKEYDINISLPQGKKQSLDALDRTYVSSMSGAQVPLRQLGSVAFETSPTVIRHYNRQRSITVTSFTKTGYNTDKVTKTILAKIDKINLPAGIRYMPSGEIESREESFGGMGTAVIVALFGIFAILVLEFGTFKSTLIVLSVIPLGIVGGILALLFTGNTLSFMASIGFVALIGIEVKNSILLVDFTNQLREKGVGLDEAIQQAGEIRFFPILLTTLTALGGLLPLAIQNSPMYSPLAWVIIGGLITSTILTRIVTPVIYKTFAPDIQIYRGESHEGQVTK